MPNVRFTVSFLKAFITKFKGLIVLGIFVGILFFVFLNYLSPILFGAEHQRIGIVGRYRVESLPNSVLALAGSGLTRVTEEGTVEPDLAESWETTDNGKTWIFTLKDDVYWQDGKKLNSQSVVYEFSDLNIERPDERTIVFKLESPFSPFPSVVSRPTFKKGLLGTGEWEVKKVRLVANFVSELVLERGRDKRIYRFYPTEETAKLAFKLGKVDTLEAIINPHPFTQWKNISISEEINYSRYVAVIFNSSDPLLSDKSIRQALSYAIDKDQFEGPRALGPISPSSWAFNPQVKPYSFDIQRAKELVDELPSELKENVSVKLVTSPALLSQAEKIAKNWKEVGIPTEVQVASSVPSEYQAFLAILDTPSDPDQYSTWHSTQLSSNISKYQSPRIDKLLEDGRVELNTEDRKKIYLDFQRFLVEDSPAAFLYHPIFYTIKRN